MKIWLDDVRTPPDETWVWAKNAYYAIGLIISGNVTYISFDHDLGKYNNESEIDPRNTGYEVASFIEEMAINIYNNSWLKPIAWDIHSANPVGRKNIEMAMKSAERFWSK